MHIFILIISLFFFNSVNAAIDFPTLKNVHKVYKNEYIDASLIYAYMAKDIYLSEVRDRGHYDKPNNQFKAHDQLNAEQKQNDWPHDSMAQFMQHAYPTPAHDGLNPAPRRPEDLFGSLTLDELGRIINYVTTHPIINENDLIKTIFAPASEWEKSTYKKQFDKLLRGQQQFRQRRLAHIIKAASDFQNSVKLYPENTLVHALSALLFWKANDKDDVKKFLSAMPDIVDTDALTTLDNTEYTESDWKAANIKMAANPKDMILNHLEEAALVEACAPIFNKNTIPLVKQGYANFSKIINSELKEFNFANCGETALNCLCNFYMYDPLTGTFNLERLNKIAKKYNLTLRPEFVKFYELFPTGQDMRKKAVLDAWAEAVSDLPDVHYNKPTEIGVCDIQSYFSNHATVLAHLFGDPILLAHAKQLREMAVTKATQSAETQKSAETDTTYYSQIVDCFWNRLNLLFSNPEKKSNDDDNDDHKNHEKSLEFKTEKLPLPDTCRHRSDQHDLHVAKVSRSDLTHFSAEFRVLGTHGKFFVKSNKGQNEDGEAKALYTADEFLSEFDKKSGPLTTYFFGEWGANVASHLSHFFQNGFSQKWTQYLTRHTHQAANVHFMNPLDIDDSIATSVLTVTLDQDLTLFDPLFRKLVKKEINAEHDYAIETLAALSVEYPNSFLREFNLWEMNKNQIEEEIQRDNKKKEQPLESSLAKKQYYKSSVLINYALDHNHYKFLQTLLNEGFTDHESLSGKCYWEARYNGSPPAIIGILKTFPEIKKYLFKDDEWMNPCQAYNHSNGKCNEWGILQPNVEMTEKLFVNYWDCFAEYLIPLYSQDRLKINENPIYFFKVLAQFRAYKDEYKSFDPTYFEAYKRLMQTPKMVKIREKLVPFLESISGYYFLGDINYTLMYFKTALETNNTRILKSIATNINNHDGPIFSAEQIKANEINIKRFLEQILSNYQNNESSSENEGKQNLIYFLSLISQDIWKKFGITLPSFFE